MSTIASLKARRVLNSRGEWTVEVRATDTQGLVGVAAVPQGKSRGVFEANPATAEVAVRNVERLIGPALRGLDAVDQHAVDEQLLGLDDTPTKSTVGGNAISGASLACARLAAAVKGVPLWVHLRALGGLDGAVKEPPRLFMNLINGGLHAGNNLDFQEYLIIPQSQSLSRAIDVGVAVYQRLRQYLIETSGLGATRLGDEGGFAPDCKDNLEPFAILEAVVRALGLTKTVDFGLDVAASNVRFGAADLQATYQVFRDRYHLKYLEDPFGENDFERFAELTAAVGEAMLVAGDDLTVTNLGRMREASAKRSINSIVITPDEIGTVSEALAAIGLARQFGWRVVASHRSGETNDDFIADFAYGVGAYGFKLGAPARGERVAKYNRLLAIETEAASTL